MEKEKIRQVIIKNIYNCTYTLKVSKQTELFVEGIDKFGEFIRLPMDEVKSMIPVSGSYGNRW